MLNGGCVEAILHIPARPTQAGQIILRLKARASYEMASVSLREKRAAEAASTLRYQKYVIDAKWRTQ
jgi:hypothetical protein